MAPDARVGTLVGSYRITAWVGRGGMGVVYEAEHTRLRRRAALKVLAPELADDSDFRARFDRESELAAALEHPNIIPVYDAGEADGVLYIAMRFVEGESLQELINRDGPLSVSRALEIVRQLGAALDAAHRRNLIHRDVKPGNVMLEPRDDGTEHAFLTDFGLVKRLDTTAQLTRRGVFTGTPDYASPEQIRGDELDGRSDQYSLGCLLFAALTGLPPFDRDDHVATMFAHISDPPPQVGAVRSDVPAELDAVLERAMAKSPDDRFPSSTAMATAARDAVTGGATVFSVHQPEPPTVRSETAPPPAPPAPPYVSVPPPPSGSPRETPGKKPRRRRGLVVLAGLVAVAVIAAAIAVVAGGHGRKGAAPPPGVSSRASPSRSTGPAAIGQTGFLDRIIRTPSSQDENSDLRTGVAVVDGFSFPDAITFTSEDEGPFFATYRLPATFTDLTGEVGVTDDTTFQSVEFTVRSGARTVTSVSVGNGEPQPFDAPLDNGARTITIQAMAKGCTFSCTVGAVWVDPVLVGSGPTPPVPSPTLAPDRGLGEVTGKATPESDVNPTFGGDSVTWKLDCDLGADAAVAFDLAGSWRTLTAVLAVPRNSTCDPIEFRFETDFRSTGPGFTLHPGDQRPITIRLQDQGPGGRLLISVHGSSHAGTSIGDAVVGNAILHGSS